MKIGRKPRNPGRARLWVLAAAALGAAILLPRGAAAYSEQVLHYFCVQLPCADGQGPSSGLLKDAAGNLYGTTYNGGTSGQCPDSPGCGVVFALAPDGTYTVLHSFCSQPGCVDGAFPIAGLIMDAAGNLYGTTSGGTGVAFKLAPDGTETVLYSFCPQSGCADGARPSGGLIMDAAGNLYGTTYNGGTSGQCPDSRGCGVVFALAPDGTESVLHSFCSQPGCVDGAFPVARLIRDAAGNLFGATSGGGASNSGVVFELAPDGMETVLYSFCQQSGCADGATPYAGLIMDAAGNLYGTTSLGGTDCHGIGLGCGVVFELAADGTQAVLYAFCPQRGCADGYQPFAGLIMDGAGNLYGTTASGGNYGFMGQGHGVVFALAPDGTEAILHSFLPFRGSGDGAFPVGDLIMDAAGTLYGTTAGGGIRVGDPDPGYGEHGGVVFKLTP